MSYCRASRPAVWARCGRPVTRGLIVSLQSNFQTQVSASVSTMNRVLLLRSIIPISASSTMSVHTTFVMEFIDGQPLRGPLPLPAVLEYSAQVLDALHAAHTKGIIHRDLKPGNILVVKRQVKLLDFGLAKHVPNVTVGESTVTSALTAEGQIVGTLQYMSPEQLQGKAADARSDLFAFGCVLYEMISGKPAFSGSNPASVIASILERDPPP